MLVYLRDYIKKQGMVSIQQLVREFQTDFSALQPMLAVWEKKGVIRKHSAKNTCMSSCFKCQPALEYYQYHLE